MWTAAAFLAAAVIAAIVVGSIVTNRGLDLDFDDPLQRYRRPK